MSQDGALFDLDKVKYFSKELLGTYSGEKMKDEAKKYAEVYNQELLGIIEQDEDKFVQIMSIEKDKENPRKDYEKYSDILEKVKFFYEPYYSEKMEQELPFNPNISKDVIKDVLLDFASSVDYSKTEQEWFADLKALGQRHGFAENNKIYKQNKDQYLGQCVVVTRHNREKTVVALDEIETVITQKLEEVRQGIYQKALENRERRTYIAHNMDEITDAINKNGDGFVKAMWCGDEECEDKVKEITGVGSRCIPLEQENLSDTCVCCGKPAKHMVYWGKAY